MSIQKTVKVPEYVDLVALLGAKDKNLDAIKADTSIKISVNGDNKIYLFGKDNEVNRIINVFDKMMEYDEYITSDHIKELRARMYQD